MNTPIKMMLFCPRCSTQHIDMPDGAWTNPPHATHTCVACGLLWRPSNVNTTGVSMIEVLEDKHRTRIFNCIPKRTVSASASKPDDLGARAVSFHEWWDAQSDELFIVPSHAIKGWAWKAWNAALSREHTDIEQSRG